MKKQKKNVIKNSKKSKADKADKNTRQNFKPEDLTEG